MAALFLFNILCAIISCDPIFRQPTPRPEKGEIGDTFIKQFRERRTLDLEAGASASGDQNSLSVHLKSFEHPPPLVKTKSGVVEGYFMRVINGRKIYAFEGIPYAESPAGKGRFKPPKPKKAWKGIRQTKDPGPICLQMHPIKLFRVVGDENCLTVNVFSPIIPIQGVSPNMSVIIWIHGGSLFYGAGSEYGPSYLLQKDVVLVTVNYRLGPLGFLSTGDKENVGNWGLKDQALAIQWVADNIKAFGGNNKNVTLMGQSAGAGSVHLHMMSNMTKHLFHRAFCISGNAFNHWSIHTPHQALKWANKLARFVGCPINKGSKVLMDCFRDQDPTYLTGNQYNLFDFLPTPLNLIRGVIEPDLPGAFITISPEEAYERDLVVKIPFITTTTSMETDFLSIVLTGTGMLGLWLRNWELISPSMNEYRLTARENVTAVTRAIADFYLPGGDPSKISRFELTQIAMDRSFNTGNRKALRYHSKIAPTYSYIFGVRNVYGYASVFGLDPNDFGVSHSEDLGFIFNSTTYFNAWNGSEEAYPVSELMVSLITNYAIKGEPLATDKNGVDHRIWDPVTDPDNPMFLQFNSSTFQMIPDPRKRELEFWDRLGLNDSYAYEYA